MAEVYTPKIVIIVRGFHTPRTDDMKTMLEDLHRAGGPAQIETGILKSLARVSGATRRAIEQVRKLGGVLMRTTP